MFFMCFVALLVLSQFLSSKILQRSASEVDLKCEKPRLNCGVSEADSILHSDVTYMNFDLWI